MILPKKPGGVLAFMSGYAAKSVPNVITAVPGGVFGTTVFSKGVIHPGTAPRNFSKIITKKHQPLFRAALQNAMNKAAKVASV
ncbi:hypothetical protein CCP3SC15_6710002 [Gammaproteobacteria bacterium]